MARAIAECTCAKCGAKFEKIQFRANRKMADEWQAWAEENCTICPDCWKQEKKEEDAVKAAALIAQTPVIDRLRYISRCLPDENYKGRKECEVQATKEGLPFQEWVEKATKKSPFYGKRILVVLHSSEAREIIDALVNC